MNIKIYYVLTAYFLSEFGRAMYLIVIGWLLYELTKDPLYTGFLVSIGFLPGLILNLVIGVIVDRFSRKKLAVSASLISSLDMIFILIAIFTGTVKPWMIMGVHMLLQVMGSLFRLSMQAFVADAFEKDQLPNIFSKTGASAEIGALFGASLGGIIIAYFSMTISMGIVVFSFVMATIAVFLTRLTGTVMIDHKRLSVFSDLIEGFSYLKENRFLFGLFMISFVGQMVLHNSVIFLSVYTREFLNKSTTIYGLLDSTISIGGIVAGILGTWWWKKSGNLVATRSLFIIFLGLLCVGFAPILPISFIGVFLIGLGTTWTRVFMQTVQQLATDPLYRGRVTSYRILFNQGSVVISGPILGWIASKYGISSTYLALLLPIAGSIVYSILQSKQEKYIQITQSL